MYKPALCERMHTETNHAQQKKKAMRVYFRTLYKSVFTQKEQPNRAKLSAYSTWERTKLCRPLMISPYI